MTKKITLKKLVLSNWRGQNREVSFRDITRISGKNESGKTAIMRAFYFCLTGLTEPYLPKNSNLYNEHEEISENTPWASVEATLEIDGLEYVIERKGVSETAWDWSVLGDNHYCDVLTGAFAVASWYHCYDNLSRVIDAEAKTGVLKSVEKIEPHVPHQDDLFHPMKNEAVVTNAGYDRGCEKELAEYLAEHGEDQTEGTGETVDPHPSEVENETDPLTEASPVPKKVVHKFVNRLSKKVHKFRKGMYRR